MHCLEKFDFLTLHHQDKCTITAWICTVEKILSESKECVFPYFTESRIFMTLKLWSCTSSIVAVDIKVRKKTYSYLNTEKQNERLKYKRVQFQKIYQLWKRRRRRQWWWWWWWW